MKAKLNESTSSRPNGTRPIDAPMIRFSIPAYKQQLKSEEAWKKNDRNGITLFKSGSYTVVMVALHSFVTIKPAEWYHIGIISLQVLEGKVEVNIENNSSEIASQEVICFHTEFAYTIKALEESVVLLTVCASQ